AAPVSAIRLAAVLEHDQRAHDVRALDMAHVVALDTPRRRLEPERVGELAERRVRLPTIGEPADPLLLEGVVRVALGELGEMPLLAALRHEQVHRTLPPLLRERDEC